MKNKNFARILLALIIFCGVFTVHCLAAGTPTTTAPAEEVIPALQKPINFEFPWEAASGQKDKTPTELVGFFYRYALALVGVAAVAMIVYGGIRYAISGGGALDIIKSAIFGLVLLLGSYVLLNTINPDIVNLSKTQENLDKLLSEARVQSEELHNDQNDPLIDSKKNPCILCAPVDKSAMRVDCLMHDEAITKLKGVSVSSSGMCADPTKASCTSLDQVPCAVITALNEMSKSCKTGGIFGLFMTQRCQIIITGGTETGHSSHGALKPMIDLSYYGNQTGDKAKEHAIALAKVLEAYAGADYIVEKNGNRYNSFAEGNWEKYVGGKWVDQKKICKVPYSRVIELNGTNVDNYITQDGLTINDENDPSPGFRCGGIDHFHTQFVTKDSLGGMNPDCNPFQPQDSEYEKLCAGVTAD